MTLFTLIIFLISLWSLSLFASRMLREDMERQLGEQQLSTVSFVAGEMNRHLEERAWSLEQEARLIDQTLLNNPATLQRMFEQRPVFLDHFNGGILVLSRDGTALADVPVRSGRRGVNYSDNEANHIALAEGKAAISGPMMGRKLKQALFNIAVPIRDAQGKVIGALVGVINLALPNFLDSIQNHRYGKSGGYLVVDPKHNLFISATDKTRVMQPGPAPGINPLFDKRVQGIDGPEVAVSSLGVENLSSSARVPVAGWFVIAALPTHEAFAPIRHMEQHITVVSILLTLMAGALTWWMVQRQLAPLLSAVKTLSTLAQSDENLQPLPITRRDEIGELIGSFNHLLEIRGRQKQALQESEFRWKFATEGTGDGLWDWNVPDSTVFVSKTWKEMLGHSEDEVGDGLDEWTKRIHPEDQAEALATLQAYLDGKTPIYVSEHRMRCRDGSYKWILDRGMVVSRDVNGKPLRLIGTHADITQRKQLEEQIRQLAYHDPLTKLPNRRLLFDRLSQTMVASKRSGRYGALMYLDLDNFKPLNDTRGHEAGDLLLQEVARRLTSCVREIDTVSRFGGDEFVVLLSDLNVDKVESSAQAEIIAEKIRLALAEPYVLTIKHDGGADSTVEHQCSASIGVMVFTQLEGS